MRTQPDGGGLLCWLINKSRYICIIVIVNRNDLRLHRKEDSGEEYYSRWHILLIKIQARGTSDRRTGYPRQIRWALVGKSTSPICRRGLGTTVCLVLLYTLTKRRTLFKRSFVALGDEKTVRSPCFHRPLHARSTLSCSACSIFPSTPQSLACQSFRKTLLLPIHTSEVQE